MQTAFQLYPFQQEAVDAVRAFYETKQHRCVLHLPTGSGKTVIVGEMARLMLEKSADSRALFLAHRRELIHQLAETLRAMVPASDVGIVMGQDSEKDGHDARIVVGSVNSVVKPTWLDRIGPRDFVVVDEAHHVNAPSYRTILDAMTDVNGTRPLYVLGMTATPDRADGQSIHDVLGPIVFSVSIEDLIKDGTLVEPIGKRLVYTRFDIDSVTMNNGDFSDVSLGQKIRVAGGPDRIADAMRLHTRGRRSIVFLPDVETADQTAVALRSVGLKAVCVTGKMPKAERDAAVAAVCAGEYDAVTTCWALAEGFDAPALDCAVIARPTLSPSAYQQMAGRVLRSHPGKENALILDVAGISNRLAIQSIASLFDAFPAGYEVPDGVSPLAELDRLRQDTETYRARSDGTIIPFDIDPFRRSGAGWIWEDRDLFIIPDGIGATVVAVKVNPETLLCDVYGVKDRRATPLHRGLSLEDARKEAEAYRRRLGQQMPPLRGPVTPRQRETLVKSYPLDRVIRVTSAEYASALISLASVRRTLVGRNRANTPLKAPGWPQSAGTSLT